MAALVCALIGGPESACRQRGARGVVQTIVQQSRGKGVSIADSRAFPFAINCPESDLVGGVWLVAGRPIALLVVSRQGFLDCSVS